MVPGRIVRGAGESTFAMPVRLVFFSFAAAEETLRVICAPGAENTCASDGGSMVRFSVELGVSMRMRMLHRQLVRRSCERVRAVVVALSAHVRWGCPACALSCRSNAVSCQRC